MVDVGYYLSAGISGLMYGLFALVHEHRRMKRFAILNIWGFVYMVATGVGAVFLFLLLYRRDQPLINLSADPVWSASMLAACAGPLSGFALRHIGAKSKATKELVSIHDKIFMFLREEIQHAVDVARVQLSTLLAEKWAGRIDDLGRIAREYVDSVIENPTDREKEKHYVAALIKEDASLVVARYIIEKYGDAWVKKHLIARKSIKPTSLEGR